MGSNILATVGFAVIALCGNGCAQKPPDTLVLRPPAAVLRSSSWSTTTLDEIADIVRRRLAGVGAQGSSVTVDKAANSVAVAVAAGGPKAELERLLTRAGVLEFRYVPQLDSREWQDVAETVGGRETGYYRLIGQDGRPLSSATLAKLFAKPPAFSGADLEPNCTVERTAYGPAIHFEFRANRKQAFEQSTRGHLNKRLAIFFDHKLVSAPMINDAIPGVGIIEGTFTLEEARMLAAQLNSAALPVPLEVVRGGEPR